MADTFCCLGQLGSKNKNNCECDCSVFQFHLEFQMGWQFVVDEGRYTCYDEREKDDELASWQKTRANEPEGLLTVAFVNQIRPYNHLLGKAENAQTTALQS